MASRSNRRQLALMQNLGRVVRDAIAREARVRQFGRLAKSFGFLARGDRVAIFSRYYWVRFVNDGHPALSFKKPKQMIFYLDPKDDPRLQGDYPKTRAGRKKLTKAQFYDDRAAGLLVVTQKVKATKPSRFIEAGIRTARSEVPKKVLELIRDDVRQNIRRRRDKITVRL